MTELKKKLIRVLLKILLGAVIFFVVTFAAYFFNLDMKLTAAMEPILMKFYDKVPRDQHL